MSGGCCPQVGFDGRSPAYRRALVAVVAINATMFLVEFLGGALARSQALQADALDFLADAATYGLSLAVIGASLETRARVAILKGLSLLAMGVGVLAATVYRLSTTGEPSYQVMGTLGVLALAANSVSVLLLLRFRDGDSNVRSVWLCSRNDAIGNVAVIGAAVAVAWTGSAWPDLLVATLMAGLFTRSAFSILRQAAGERRLVQAVESARA